LVTDASGNQGCVPYAQAATANSMVMRDAKGNTSIASPTADMHVANKSYVDKIVGNIGLSSRSFGAVGNGLADDTAALQEALNAAQSRRLVIEPGTYLISGPLRIKRGTLLSGYGATIIRKPGFTNMMLVNYELGVIWPGFSSDRFIR